MTTLGVVHARARSRVGTWVSEPFHVDAAIGALVVAVTLVTTTAGPGGGRLDALTLVTVTAAGGVLAVRRRYPFAALLVSALAAETFLAHHDGRYGTLVLAAPLVALATVAELSPRRLAILAGGVVVLSIGIAHVWVRPAVLGPENLALAAFGGLAVAAGTASRHRRAYLAEVQARADRAEADREAEADRRVTEERLRIARDLHDVLGHHLALIHIQARVAARALDDPGGVAAGALDHVCAASKTALTELGDTIGLLRRPGEPADPTEPVGDLDALDGLLAAYRRSGLDITATVDGDARPVTAPVGLTAYRVIQESLTNVCKHAGPTRVSVRLSFAGEAVEVTVDNRPTGRPASGAGGGHGLVGMRERVAALGGRFAAGPRPDGSFRVTAQLPLAAAP
jgi:signal transduction histidine kinase